MAETDIGSTAIGNLEGTETLYSVPTVETDAATDQKETEYINTNWSQQLGYYKTIPELKISIDAKATWTVGKGIKAPEVTEMLLASIKGHNKDTFNTILENMIRTMHISGDSYAEIIRDDENILVNIKPLDPGKIKIVANKKGLIIRYELINKGPNTPFKPEEILHLSRNRVADEMHGESIVDSVEWIILARNEAMADMKKAMHRHVKPLMMVHLDTDDDDEINALILKFDEAMEKGENIYVPKDIVTSEVVAVSQNATMNPLPWIQQLNSYFFQATGVPQIIVGGGSEITEASAKIAYLAFEQTIEEDQLYIEEQVLSQLNLEIELEFPASLENELLTDKSKSETTQASTPEDTSVTNMGVNNGTKKEA